MSSEKYSRRKFIGAACLLASSGLALSAIPIPAETKSYPLLAEGTTDLEKITALLKQKEPVIWLFTGDSITEGVKHTHGYRSFPEIFSERVRWELQRSRDIVINSAISGHTTVNILNDFDWRVTQFKPSVVFLMIGTNDCSTTKHLSVANFETNLNTLVNKIKATNAIPVLLTPNVILANKAPERASLPEYIPVIRKVAEKYKLVLIDNYAYWKNAIDNEPEKAVFKNWLNDPLHPNATGHQEIARLIFKSLNIFNPADATCGGSYYEGDH